MSRTLHLQSFSLVSMVFPFNVFGLLQCFLLILHCCTHIQDCQIFLQRDIVHLFRATVFRFLWYGWVWVSHYVPWKGGVHVDRWGACASTDAAGSHCGGSSGKPTTCQMRLTAGAVVVQTHNHRAISIAAADHRALPVKGQIPTCPGFLYFCLDLKVHENCSKWKYHFLSIITRT